MAFQLRYSYLDRLVHRLAFSTPAIQFTAADIESAVFNDLYRDISADRPIFITSLPRAGTTLLLEALHLSQFLASQTYRDMPLVMAPLFWSRLTEPFRKPAVATERAHGDGMIVGQDSPEGFEEILWRSFWPEHYLPDRIVLWTQENQKDDAQEFFSQHMKKIIALRRPRRSGDGRYISKNNGNMARLDLLQQMFPGAKIVVPVRSPLSHAASLMRQHLNFQDMHRREPFSQRYMADLGHYEFGVLHRPIAFPGLTDWTGGRDAVSIDYWLGYWIAAFEYVLERRDKVILISYEAICADPHQGLARLCHMLKIPQEQLVDRAAVLFRRPPAPRDEASQSDRTLRRHAEALHKALLEPFTGEQAN